MKTKTIKIPQGWEIDTEKSIGNKIVLKEIKEKYPKYWKELDEVKGYYISSSSTILSATEDVEVVTSDYNKNIVPKKKHAEAILALSQLLQLREKYWEIDGKPDWNSDTKKYCIKNIGTELNIDTFTTLPHIFAFNTKEAAEHFLNTHKKLLNTFVKIYE